VCIVVRNLIFLSFLVVLYGSLSAADGGSPARSVINPSAITLEKTTPGASASLRAIVRDLSFVYDTDKELSSRSRKKWVIPQICAISLGVVEALGPVDFTCFVGRIVYPDRASSHVLFIVAAGGHLFIFDEYSKQLYPSRGGPSILKGSITLQIPFCAIVSHLAVPIRAVVKASAAEDAVFGAPPTAATSEPSGGGPAVIREPLKVGPIVPATAGDFTVPEREMGAASLEGSRFIRYIPEVMPASGGAAPAGVVTPHRKRGSRNKKK